MFSSDYFAEHLEPFEKRVVDAIHAQDTFSIYHNCGAASGLCPDYQVMGFAVWETVSEASAGDNNLAEAKAFFGDSLCLLGNLDQIHFLKTASANEIAEKTRQIVAEGKPGGHYFFSTSDFLEKGTPLANVRVMIESAKEAGRYE